MCAAGECGKQDLSLIKLSDAGALLLVRRLDVWLDESIWKFLIIRNLRYMSRIYRYTTGYVFTIQIGWINCFNACKNDPLFSCPFYFPKYEAYSLYARENDQSKSWQTPPSKCWPRVFKKKTLKTQAPSLGSPEKRICDLPVKILDLVLYYIFFFTFILYITRSIF